MLLNSDNANHCEISSLPPPQVMFLKKKMLDCNDYPYIMQIFIIHKPAELTKTMDLTVSFFIEKSLRGPLHKHYWYVCNQAFYL